jgi:hypothetical protein
MKTGNTRIQYFQVNNYSSNNHANGWKNAKVYQKNSFQMQKKNKNLW